MQIKLSGFGLSFKKINIKIDGKDIPFIIDKNGIVASVDITEGMHSLTIQKNNSYATKMAYINVLNPIFWCKQFKLMNRSEYLYDEDYMCLKIDFKIMNSENANINCELKNKEIYDEGLHKVECDIINFFGLKVIKKEYHSISDKIRKRFKIVNVANQLFWNLLISIVSIVYISKDKELLLSGILATIILNIFTGFKIIKILNSKKTR